MLTIKRAKGLQGTLTLPSSPDLFLCAAFTALAARRTISISNLGSTPLIEQRLSFLGAFFDIARSGDCCTLAWREWSGDTAFQFDNDRLPCRDLIVFLALSTRLPVRFRSVTDGRLAFWKEQAFRLGYTVEIAEQGAEKGMRLVGETVVGAPVPQVAEQDIHAALGLYWGLRAKRTFQIDFSLSSPFRHLAGAFGCDISVKRDIGEAEKDPLLRRMKIQTRQRLSSQEQLFTVSFDFSRPMPEDPVSIDLPGDELLLAHVLLAKSILHRGTLMIDNAPLEPWASPMLTLMRKMGCKPSLQETRDTAFGSCGMISVQRFELSGQKTDCSSPHQLVHSLPALALLGAFAEGESVFRKFDDLRRSDPDGIKQLESCLKTMQVKFGDIPDGFVIKGSQEYDGFDLIEPLPADIAGAFAMAGHACVGSTTIHDQAINERWPGFSALIEKYFEFRS